MTDQEDIVSAICQHLQQFGVEVTNLEHSTDRCTIETLEYGHHISVYFHNRGRHRLYFAPMDPNKKLDPSNLAESIRQEFKFEIDVTVTKFPKSVVERRVREIEMLQEKMRRLSESNMFEECVNVAKQLKRATDFSVEYRMENGSVCAPREPRPAQAPAIL